MGQYAEESLIVLITNAEEHLHVTDGIAVALTDPLGTLRIITGAEDPDAARMDLIAAYDLSEVQATAVLDLQFRRATRRDLARLAEGRAGVAQHLDRLRSMLPSSED